MTEKTCATCAYWHSKGGSWNHAPKGQCRRRAPREDDYWPSTSGQAWCGEYRKAAAAEIDRREDAEAAQWRAVHERRSIDIDDLIPF